MTKLVAKFNFADVYKMVEVRLAAGKIATESWLVEELLTLCLRDGQLPDIHELMHFVADFFHARRLFEAEGATNIGYRDLTRPIAVCRDGERAFVRVEDANKPEVQAIADFCGSYARWAGLVAGHCEKQVCAAGVVPFTPRR